jgi:predicted ATPase/class 3 adenylate cyclase
VDEFPTGVVTFLFTDVEGSTRLLERLGDRYSAVRDGHDRILQSAIGDNGGRVVDTAGDGFFAVFPSPRRAVSAAARAQRELAAAPWPDGIALRVRMGVHTGDGVVDGSGYVGLDVHRAARISAAGHGGQVLVSEATRALVADALPVGASLEDLGVHRLRGLTRSERLYQLTVAGLDQGFPPPRTEDARTGNLPTRLTGFVGRTDQVREIGELIRDHRLVTLTGPGGTGKTRLALHVAEGLRLTFADGVFFVDLSSVRDPALVPAAVSAALSLTEPSGRPATEVVRTYLEHRSLLLVLDNLEQVIDAGAFVEELLGSAPGVRVLGTSRVPMHLYGEQEFAVPPLTLPPGGQLDPDDLGRSEAVQLFVQRASAVKAGFRLTEENAGAVAEIVARLDGLPLAIELAASRVKLLPPRQLLPRLERRLALLTSAGRSFPERQRTLRATLDWSHDLLPDPERRLLRRLSVFAGGADLGAVEAVANPDAELGDTLELLATLVDDNLVRSLDDPGGEPRFGMLETIREYASDHLSSSGEESVVRRRHAEHWAAVAEEASGALPGTSQEECIRRLDRELDNLRGALDWTVAAEEAELGLRIAVALDDYWLLGSHVREGVARLSELLSLYEGAGRTPLRARALSALGGLHGWIDDPERMIVIAEEALAIYRDLGDDRGQAAAMGNLGWAQLQLGRPGPAKTNLTEAIDRHLALGDQPGTAGLLPALGLIAQSEGDLSEARRHFEAALTTLRDGGDAFMTAMIESMIGGVDRQRGDFEAATRRYHASLVGYLRMGNVMGVSWVLFFIADVAAERGQPRRALRLIGASDRLRGGTELPNLVAASVHDVDLRARRQLDESAAADAYQQGHALSQEEAVAYARDERPEDDAWNDTVQAGVR